MRRAPWVLPVLVADYFALHLLAYALFTLALLQVAGVGIGRLAWLPGLALALYGIFVFGGAPSGRSSSMGTAVRSSPTEMPAAPSGRCSL